MVVDQHVDILSLSRNRVMTASAERGGTHLKESCTRDYGGGLEASNVSDLIYVRLIELSRMTRQTAALHGLLYEKRS